MTTRRRTANPIFQKPLTKAEADSNLPAPPKPNYIRCRHCGSTGTLFGRGLRKVDDDQYECNDKDECSKFASRKSLKERRKPNE
jgi:hypothetical protein